MHKILFVNHKEIECGVYQYGATIAKELKNSQKYEYIYKEISGEGEYLRCLHEIKPVATIFNWHAWTLRWLSVKRLRPNSKNIFIIHDSHPGIDSPVIYLDPDYIENNNNFKVGRLIIPFVPLSTVVEDNIIGSFGFGFEDKGFEKIVRQVNKEFDMAKIRLHLPNSRFSDPDGKEVDKRIDTCKGIANPGIEIEVSRVFLNISDLLLFLSQNTINVFLYEDKPTIGISSVIDFALSAKRPIAVSKSTMFRHICNPDIVLDTDSSNTLKTIISKGLSPLENYYKRWTPEKLIADFDRIVDHVLKLSL